MRWLTGLALLVLAVGIQILFAAPPIGGPDIIINDGLGTGLKARVTTSAPGGADAGLVVWVQGGSLGGGSGGGDTMLVNGNEAGKAIVTNAKPDSDTYGLGVRLITDPNDPLGISGTSAGDAAHDSVDIGNPLKIGGRAHTSLPAAVSDGDRVNALYDKFGRQMTATTLRELEVHGTATLTTTTETTILSAVASMFLDITAWSCSNSSATKVTVSIRDATAGSVINKYTLAADGGGFNLTFPTPVTQTTANQNWTVQLSGAVTDVTCFFQAVKTL